MVAMEAAVMPMPGSTVDQIATSVVASVEQGVRSDDSGERRVLEGGNDGEGGISEGVGGLHKKSLVWVRP